jgi:uncharacterized membrane protein YgaE (UPF0421/DUF939 family)
MDMPYLDDVRARGRTSVAVRVRRWQGKSWHVAQCAIAAGLAWLVAADLLGHQTPFFAPIAAIAALGTSYGQRLRRVGEVAVGVAIGVLIGDLLVSQIGTGWWQLSIIVALAMSTAILLDGGQLFVTQAAVQAIVVATLAPTTSGAFTRWTDALVGGSLALLAAAIVPAAPLRRPREQAAVVIRKIAGLLRVAGDVMESGEVEPALALLADARATDYLIRELQAAADEGLAVVASSPFRLRHRPGMRRMAELVDPLDKSLRTTRVLVRRTAVAAYHRRAIPASYVVVCRELADAADVLAEEFRADPETEGPSAARAALMAVGQHTAELQRSHALSIEVVLAMLRGLVADLLELTGLSPLEATDALPAPRRDWLDDDLRHD